MLKKNDEAIVIIDNYGYEGEGVARIDGVAVFVPYSAVGDKLKIKIVKTAKTHMFGKIIEIIEPSKERVVPPCPVFGKCGGCSLMHISYDAQLEMKRQRVADCMKKIGKSQAEILPTLPSEKVFHYRNKVQVPIGGGNMPYSGFYANRSHRIIQNDKCLLQDIKTKKIVPEFICWMKENNITAYDEETGKGLVRHLFIRCSSSDEILVMPIINGNKLPNWETLAKKLEGLGVTTLCININKKNTNVILGDKTKVLFGSGYIKDTLCENTFKVSPESFYQVNKNQAEKLYYKAMELAEITKDDVVYDLYCGAGTITLCAAKYAKKVYGVEIVPEAVVNAKENGDINRIKNVEYLCGDVAENVRKLKKIAQPDIIIVDPPRKGCDKAALELLVEISPKKIVYISCNPATFARDVESLEKAGYNCKKVQPVDLFPQTSHVECCALLCRTQHSSI